MEIYRGNILFTAAPEAITVYEHGYIAVQDGKIISVGQEPPEQALLPALSEEAVTAAADSEGHCRSGGCGGNSRNGRITVSDFGDSLIIPGFNDIHVHAPQWCNSGIGFSLELLPWLQKYTFPAEAHFADGEFAKQEYTRFVNELLKHGTLRACIFGSRHTEATKTLVRILKESGMGAFVGKVNMDRNSIPELQEDTDASVRETETLIRWMAENDDGASRVKYILTPRYVPCTTSRLMDALGELGERYDLPVQSHLDENRDEVAWVKQLHPESSSFADVYNSHGLLRHGQTIMAHCIHMTEEELALLKQKEVLIAHCAMSNADLASGIMPLRKYLDYGLKVAVASDMGGSHSVKMAEHIVDTIKCSKLYWFYHPEYRPVSFSEAFYMATKAGGSFFGKVGSFEPGYEFDALVIDDTPIRTGISHSVTERLERFIYIGDSSCIRKRYVSGRECSYPIKDNLI